MKKIIMMFIGAILSLYELNAEIPVVVADISVDAFFLDQYDDRFYTDLLYHSLYTQNTGRDYTYLLARSIGDSKIMDWKIKNEIDAYAIIDNLDLNYLIYGFITSGNNSFEAVYNIYSKKDEKIIRKIVYRSPVEDRETFLAETAFKINIAVHELLTPALTKDDTGKIMDDIDKYNRQKAFKNRVKDFRLHEYLGFDFSAGYVIPCGRWNELFLGIIDLETGLKVVRLPYLFKNDLFKLAIQPGFTFAYTLAKNQPDIVEEYWHAFSFRFPVELLLIINDKYTVNACADFHIRSDSYYQDLYGVTQNSYSTTTCGWAIGCGFGYALDKDGLFTLGLNSLFDFAVYDVFYFDFKIQPFLRIKFRESVKAEKMEINDIKIKL